MRHGYKKIAVFLIIALLAASLPARAQEEEALRLYEQKIKAGLVYNFLKFSSWPPGAMVKTGNKLNVCLYGGDSFDGYLYPLEGKTAQQYTISITSIDSLDEASGCSLLFVNQSKGNAVPDLLRILKGQPVLTVSDIDDFAEEGGMVEMTKENQSVRLYINEAAAEDSGIRIQGSILKLAKAVSTKKS